MQLQRMKTTINVAFGIRHILTHLYASLSPCQQKKVEQTKYKHAPASLSCFLKSLVKTLVSHMEIY